MLGPNVHFEECRIFPEPHHVGIPATKANALFSEVACWFWSLDEKKVPWANGSCTAAI
jgi:hypothetical protein